MKRRKDGLYASQVYLGMVDGKRKYKTVYGKTQKEVKTAVAELKIKLGKGIDIAAADDTFGAWATYFLEDKKAEGIGHSHYSNLQSFCKHLSPIHSLPLSKITTADIQRIINRLAEWHDGNPPLSKRTLSGIRQTACQVYRKAIASRLVDYNPAEYVTIPRTASVQKRTAIQEYQHQWIIDTPHRAQRAAMIMLYAGLRKGELTALTWADINFKASTIDVKRSVEYISGQPSIKPPKTDAGNRVVSIPSVLCNFLQEEKKKDTSIYVVHMRDGRMMSKIAWQRLWDSYMLDLNLKYGYSDSERPSKFAPSGIEIKIKTFTPHQLRHTFATLLYHAGVDVLTARDQLGHTDIKTTLGIYTHLDKEHKKKSINKLEEYLSVHNS